LTGKKKLHTRLLFVILSLILSSGVWGLTVQSQLDKSRGSIEDEFSLSVIISGSQKAQVETPFLEGLKIYETGTSYNMSMIGRSVKMELTHSFVLIPKKAGTFIIPPIKVTVDGKTFLTRSLKLRISEVPSIQVATRDVFLKRICSNHKPYKGEVIFCVTRLYHRQNISRIEVENQKSDYFRKFQVEESKKSFEMHQGIRYHVVMLKEFLVPLQVGSFPVDRMSLHVEIHKEINSSQRGQSLFDLFGGFSHNRVVKKRVVTPELIIHVQQLPEFLEKGSFTELVGKFSLSTNLSSRAITVGDTLTLTLRFQGQGSFDSMSDLLLNFPVDLKVYPDKPIMSQKLKNSSALIGEKIFKYALVPEKAKTYDLGSHAFWTFDPTKNAYVSHHAVFGNISVKKSLQQEKFVESLSISENLISPQHRLKKLHEDLIDLHRHISLKDHRLNPDKQFLLWGGMLGSLCFFFMGQLFNHRKQKKDDYKRRSVRAKRVFDKKWRKLSNDERNIEELFGIIKEYIGQKFHVHAKALTVEDILHHLKTHGMDQENLNKIGKQIKGLEMLVFLEKKLSIFDWDDLYHKISVDIKEIERLCS